MCEHDDTNREVEKDYLLIQNRFGNQMIELMKFGKKGVDLKDITYINKLIDTYMFNLETLISNSDCKDDEYL